MNFIIVLCYAINLLIHVESLKLGRSYISNNRNKEIIVLYNSKSDVIDKIKKLEELSDLGMSKTVPPSNDVSTGCL